MTRNSPIKPRKGTRITIVWEVAESMSVERAARLCEGDADRFLRTTRSRRPVSITAVPCVILPPGEGA